MRGLSRTHQVPRGETRSTHCILPLEPRLAGASRQNNDESEEANDQTGDQSDPPCPVPVHAGHAANGRVARQQERQETDWWNPGQ